jgi:hypothetical protein
MRRLFLLALALTFVTLSFPSLAQAQCACPQEAVHLYSTVTPGFLSDCPLQHHNGQQNAGFWAGSQCQGRGGACTYLYTPIDCWENPDGSVTADGLLTYRCNFC